MKPQLLNSLAALILLAALAAVIKPADRQAPATPTAPPVSSHRAMAATISPTAGTRRHPDRTEVPQLQHPDTAALLEALNVSHEAAIDLELASRLVESFRLAPATELPRLAAAIAENPLPLAKGLMAQALLRIPDPQVVQTVFHAACAETEPAAREAVLLAFHSLESPAARELLTTAIAASDDPQILSFIHAFITHNPQPDTGAILEELATDETTPPACQEAIRSALAGLDEQAAPQ
jgi:hypothetical protein